MTDAKIMRVWSSMPLCASPSSSSSSSSSISASFSSPSPDPSSSSSSPPAAFPCFSDNFVDFDEDASIFTSAGGGSPTIRNNGKKLAVEGTIVDALISPCSLIKSPIISRRKTADTG